MTEDNKDADYSLRILWSLARWIEDVKGPEALAKVAREAGVAPKDFDGTTRWVSHQQLETILTHARELAGSEETLREAFAYRFKESYGAFRYMVWAVSQQRMAETAAKMGKVFTRVGSFEVLSSSRNSFSFRYRSTKEESRLLCLSRQVAWSMGSTIYGNPPAQLREGACIARGDEYCEYDLKWLDHWRLFPVVAGIGLGGGAAVAMSALNGAGVALGALPLLGAALGYILELRRTSAINITFASEANEALQQLGQTEAETRSEIFALHQRQRDWIRAMEEQVSDRTTTLERVVEGLTDIQQDRVTTLRGFSHDLRNPLFVIRGNAQYLKERFRTGTEEAEVMTDIETASVQIENMLTTLMEMATEDAGFVKTSPQPLEVAGMADTLRRRLKALVHGRDIKVSVFCTREAPDQLIIDPLVFDRIVDNLLTNAAKYTPGGSILLEVGGTPGSALSRTGSGAPAYLTLKLSDTGQGIPPSDIERIFRPRPASEPRGPSSYGVGLSSVVRLLAQIGGRIDVMSKPGVGTTFWAHFPLQPAERESEPVGDDNFESMITRIVTIRRAEGL